MGNDKKRLVDKVGFLTKNKKHVSDELEATEQDDYDFTRVEFYDDEGWYSISKKEFDEWVQEVNQKPNHGIRSGMHRGGGEAASSQCAGRSAGAAARSTAQPGIPQALGRCQIKVQEQVPCAGPAA